MLHQCRVWVHTDGAQKGSSHPNTCQSLWIRIKFASASFSVNSTMSRLSNPACTLSSFWGFVICFGMWVWRGSPHVTHIFLHSWKFFYHSSSSSSPSHCKLSFGYPSLWWLHICSPALPHFTPAKSLVSSSPLFPYNTLLCVPSWQDQQTNNIMHLSLGTEKMTDEPNTPWAEKERKNSTWQGSWTTYASPSLSSCISQDKHSRSIGL